jgi:hypothetical protein
MPSRTLGAQTSLRGPHGGVRVGQHYHGGIWYGAGRLARPMAALWRRRVLAMEPDWLSLDPRVTTAMRTNTVRLRGR